MDHTTLRLACVAAGVLLPLAMAQAQTQTLTVGNHTFTLPSNTAVIIDDQPGVLGDMLARSPGMLVRWSPAPGDPSRGAVPMLVFSYSLIGPVTRSDPLEVLGQRVTLTADTTLEGFASGAPLPLGTPMIIAALVDPNGTHYASLAVRRVVQGNTFLLAGYVQQLAASQPRIRVGNQWINTTGVGFADCIGGVPVVGDYLVIRADSVLDFAAGDPLDTVTSARCASAVPPGTPGAQGFLDGIVGTVPTAMSFALGSLTIIHDAATVFAFGGPDDLEPGVALSTEGVFIDATTFAAASVEFVRPAVRFEAPMLPVDVSPGQSLRPFGVTVHGSGQLRDEDGILANGLSAPTQVQVRGWIDRAGVAFATRVRERGDPDAADVALRGPVEAFVRPLLTVQGLTVDTTSAVLLDADNLPLTPAQFFADLRINHMVDVGGAAWNPGTRTLLGGTIILLGYEHTQPVPGVLGAVVSGIVTDYGTEAPLFGNGFEAP